MGSLLGALGGAAAARLEQGQRDAAAASSNAGFNSTMASLKNAQAVYEGITVIKQVSGEVKADFVKTREWIAGVQENVNEARGEIRAGWDKSTEAANNTNALLKMAGKVESDHVKIAEAFNAMADVVSEMKQEISALRSTIDLHQPK